MKRLLRPDEVAEKLQCTKRHVYNLISRGELRALSIGDRGLRVDVKDLDGFIEKRKQLFSEAVGIFDEPA